MRRFFPPIILLLVVVYLSVTGFQCGSAEITTARLAITQKQWTKAEESLMKALQKNDKDEEAWFLLGQVRYELKKYAEMNEAYSNALAISDAHKPDIDKYRLSTWAEFFNAGIAYYNKGRDSAAYYDKALASFSNAIIILPDSASTYYVKALAHYAKKDYPNAIMNLETTLKKDPSRMDAARLLGQIHLTLGREKKERKDESGAAAEYEAATTAFEKAYAMSSNNPDTSLAHQQSVQENITNLIEVYELTDKTEKAMTLTRDAVTSDPNNGIFRFAYGVFLLKQNQFEQSIEQLKKALEIKPDDPDATYNCGVAYLNWGVAMKAEIDKRAEPAKGKKEKEDLSFKEKFKAALPYLEKSAELRKDDAALMQQLGKLYANLNMVEKSKKAFDQADRIMKNN